MSTSNIGCWYKGMNAMFELPGPSNRRPLCFFWSLLGCFIWQLVAGDLQYDGAQTAAEVVALRIRLRSFA